MKKKNRELLNWLSTVLPTHYKFELLQNGVNCKSPIGINENTKEWNEFLRKLKRQVQTYLREIYHEVNHDHKEFTIFTTYKR